MRITVNYKLPKLPSPLTLNVWAEDIAERIKTLTRRPPPAVGVLVVDRHCASFDVAPTTVASDELQAIADAVINPGRSLDVTVTVS